jgi:phosphoribosylcarboxyaminoimidazole (NCAIR) mutase
MKKDPADPKRPRVGSESKCLGVRTIGNFADIDIDHSGCVLLNRKGMSVAATWRILPPHLIPEELDDGVNGARGKGMEVFVLGSGGFDEGLVSAALELCYKPNSTDAGNVCPVASVPVADFQADLAATRPDWVIDPS